MSSPTENLFISVSIDSYDSICTYLLDLFANEKPFFANMSIYEFLLYQYFYTIINPVNSIRVFPFIWLGSNSYVHIIPFTSTEYVQSEKVGNLYVAR